MKLIQILAVAHLLLLGQIAFTRGAYDSAAGNKLYESVTVTFSEGSSVIAGDDRTKLIDAVARAKTKGNIQKVEIAAWSDKDYPTVTDLLSADRKLASDRITAVKDVLRPQVGRFEIITSYNMADRADWLARMFNTTEAELDSVYAKKDLQAMEREDIKMIKAEGAPRKAVVILKVKAK